MSEVIATTEVVTMIEKRQFAYSLITRRAETMDVNRSGIITDSVLADAVGVLGRCWDTQYRIWFEPAVDQNAIRWFGVRCSRLPNLARNKLMLRPKR